MTPAEFRRLALSLPGTLEKAHMGHPDFRVGRKIFATLGYPDASHGTVMVKPHEQDLLVQEHPRTFTPVSGAWGRAGATSVKLAKAPRRAVALALESAWHRRATAKLLAEHGIDKASATARPRRGAV
jgi:hypothetical protein